MVLLHITEHQYWTEMSPAMVERILKLEELKAKYTPRE